MAVLLWILGVLFALSALPALFYFVLYVLQGESTQLDRAQRFFVWTRFVFLLTFNVGIWGHVVIALLQIWGILS